MAFHFTFSATVYAVTNARPRRKCRIGSIRVLVNPSRSINLQRSVGTASGQIGANPGQRNAILRNRHHSTEGTSFIQFILNYVLTWCSLLFFQFHFGFASIKSISYTSVKRAIVQCFELVWNKLWPDFILFRFRFAFFSHCSLLGDRAMLKTMQWYPIERRT